MGVHSGATWRIRLNRPCAAAIRPFCESTLATYYTHDVGTQAVSWWLLTAVISAVQRWLTSRASDMIMISRLRPRDRDACLHLCRSVCLSVSVWAANTDQPRPGIDVRRRRSTCIDRRRQRTCLRAAATLRRLARSSAVADTLVVTTIDRPSALKSREEF